MPNKKTKINRQARTIKIKGGDEVYTRFSKREYETRREMFDNPDYYVRRIHEKFRVGQKITTTERDLLGLIKRRPGAYKYYANRPASATERKRKERARKKLTLGKALKEEEKKLLGL
ncbi:17464_t:CDS:2 [Cetraspora pellucida]|uniref:17464_t:CDS:1 n=1 Tax=Cetraspora pellucida TaxID=1433469 RepID=A0ACA9NIV4_9GLOM|nr:17464_t:CDS:2 [Cetraspora pellucida]